jgi:hypothetical protein
MINFLSYLYSKLVESGKQVYSEVAPVKDPVTQLAPVFPYVVYRLGTSLNDENNREDFPLIINVWDKGSNTTSLEILADSIDKKLNNLRYLDENQQLTFAKESRSPISDPDLNIKGRQIRYTVKRYER